MLTGPRVGLAMRVRQGRAVTCPPTDEICMTFRAWRHRPANDRGYEAAVKPKLRDREIENVRLP